MITVAICSHNPRPNYLARVLEALKAQTLPREAWELLLIDNASENRLAEAWDLSWHPSARHVREDVLGLTPARLRAISEAAGDVLVLVDDDNVLFPDYLEQCLTIAGEWPILVAWGGQQFPESPDLRRCAGGKARQTVLERYSLSSILPQVRTSYQRAIAAMPRSRRKERRG